MPDYLPFTDFTVDQGEDMYHFNSDSVLLGRFMMAKHSHRVLDIGCNQGVLMLYASLHKPAEITGIDLFPEVLELCRHNLEMNHVSANLVCTNLQSYQDDPYHVIVCNPPYYESADHLRNENKYLRAARHTESLNTEDLFAGVDRLLHETGTFYTICRSSQLMKVINTAQKHHLFPSTLRIVYDHPEGTAKSVLMAFTRSKTRDTEILYPAYLNDKNTY